MEATRRGRSGRNRLLPELAATGVAPMAAVGLDGDEMAAPSGLVADRGANPYGAACRSRFHISDKKRLLVAEELRASAGAKSCTDIGSRL
jgi:hypothetical protein